MGYGVAMSCSLVEQDGSYELGVTVKNSEGIDIDYTISGDDPKQILEDAIYDILEEIYLQEQVSEEKDSDEEVEDNDHYIAYLEKLVSDLEAENDSLKMDNEILQRRADDAVNQTMKKKERSESYNPYDYLWDLLNK